MLVSARVSLNWQEAGATIGSPADGMTWSTEGSGVTRFKVYAKLRLGYARVRKAGLWLGATYSLPGRTNPKGKAAFARVDKRKVRFDYPDPHLQW